MSVIGWPSTYVIRFGLHAAVLRESHRYFVGICFQEGMIPLLSLNWDKARMIETEEMAERMIHTFKLTDCEVVRIDRLTGAVSEA